MRSIWSVVAVLAVGCGGGKTRPDAGMADATVPDAAPDPRRTVLEVPATPITDLDLLFMIDDSAGMSDKQQALVNTLPALLDRLSASPNGLPSLHIGVITSDMGTKGSASATPAPTIGQVGSGGCGGLGKNGALQVGAATSMVTGLFVSDIRQTDGTRVKNYTGNLADVLAAMMRVGGGGCGFEQPLAAIRAALDNNPTNAGFLRPAAQLGIILVTDEDDCSVRDPAFFGPDNATLGPVQSFRCTRFGVTCATGGATSDMMNQIGAKSDCAASTSSTLLDGVAGFHDFLVALKTDPSRVFVAAIMGNPTPVIVELRAPPGGGSQLPALAHSCAFVGGTGTAVADPGVRIQSLLDLFPGRSTTTSVCMQDLSAPLDLIAQLATNTLGAACLLVPLAPQPDCIAEDIVGGTATPIAPCDASNTPTCWRLATDATACPSVDHLKLVVERAGTAAPGTVTRLQCFVAP